MSLPESSSGQQAVTSGPELSSLPLNALMLEVLRRKEDLLTEEGFLSREAYELVDFLGTRVCVDGAAVRVDANKNVELMAIRRNTGPCAGKLCLVGGGVGRVTEGGQLVPESLGEALRRHFRTDLGFDIDPLTTWHGPTYIAQDMRPIDGEIREGFTPNPNSRHLIAARCLVRIKDSENNPVFGNTEFGGQEASGIEWFNEQPTPDDSEFGYGMGDTYRAMFGAAKTLLGTEA